VDEARGAVWRPIADVDGLWHAERVAGNVPLRSVAVRLGDERLVVCSPVRELGARAHRELSRLGRPAFLVCPNHFHNLGIREYVAAYPGAVAVGSQKAAPRLARKTGQDVRDEGALAAALPSSVGVLVPPATRQGELWLSVALPDGGRAWIVGDGFFNLARTPRTFTGLLLWLLGVSPGLGIGGTFRLMLRDRAAYRAWLLDALEREKPTLIVPCHGDIVHEPGLAHRLRALAEAL